MAALALSVVALALPRGVPVPVVLVTVAIAAGFKAQCCYAFAAAAALQLASACVFRLSLVVATLLHEWSHIAFGALVGQQLLSATNLLGGLSMAQWAQVLQPFGGGTSLSPRVVASKPAGCTADALTAAAGLIFSVALAAGLPCASAWAARADTDGAALLCGAACAGVTLCALCSASSDGADVVELLRRGKGLQAFRCGNFGVLLAAAAAGCTDAVAILERMTEITMGRGGQSGGVCTFLPTASGLASVRARVRPGRREAMHSLLSSVLRRRLRWAALTHRPPARGSAPSPRLFMGHTRFATSSLPSVGESHPHQWTPPRPVQVWRVRGGRAVEAVEEFSLFITHNGDFDFLNLYGRERTHNDVAHWLHRVLHVPPPAKCDSARVAGCLEMYRTEGIWMPALRLAYQTTVAECFEAAFDYQTPGADAPHAAPSARVLDALADTASATFATFASKLRVYPGANSLAELVGESEPGLVAALTAALVAPACDVDVAHGLAPAKLHAFAAAAVAAFLHNDLYAALRSFMERASGSFGLAVGCSLDSDRVALAALNQPMGMAFSPHDSLVLYGSEANALAVQLHDAEVAPWRIDIDSVEGEVFELRWAAIPSGDASPDPSSEGGRAAMTAISASEAMPFWPFAAEACPLRLRVFNLRRREGVSRESLLAARRLIDMRDNPYLLHDARERQTTARPGAGRVENDIRDTARVLRALRVGWDAPGSLNGASADAMLAMLKARALDATAEEARRSGRLDVDVLVTGVESSLWVAEQFASDMQNMFPHLRVVAISANKVIGVLGNARGAISAAGFSFCRLTTKLDNTICIAVSHSGQTFPTMHATAILERACPGRVFVVAGAVDSKMAAAVGQSLAKGAPFSGRVFSTGAGWRSAEPASVSSVATHHLLTELLLHLARGMQADPDLAARGLTKPLGLRLSAQDVSDLTLIGDSFVAAAVPCLTGVDAAGGDVSTPARDALLAQGRQWGWNILEAPVVWAFVASYIAMAVIFGVPVFRVMLNFAIRSITGQGVHYDWWRPDFTAPEWYGRVKVYTALYYVAGALDATLFIFLPAIATVSLRLAQGRQALARVKGRRTLVIADVPFVHQLLEMYVSKLFSLSFGIAGVDVHGANGLDHFVHRFTHRVARGVMLAFGRPDGRLCSQTKCESWVLMALLQARTIANLGAGPEVLTVGHNPHVTALMDAAIILPSHRPRLLCESVLEVTAHDPLARMAALSHAVESGAAPTLFTRQDNDKSRRAGAAPGFQRMFTAPIGAHLCCDPGAAAEMAAARRLAAGLVITVAEAERGTLHGGTHLGGDTHRGGTSHSGSAGGTAHGPAPLGPAGRDAVLSSMAQPVLDLLESQAPIEEFIENRYLSAERWVAFLVMFHQMAQTVASFAPLRWDTSRSQSCLRVATTAAPISAADLVRTWQAGTAAGLDDVSLHGGAFTAANGDPPSPRAGTMRRQGSLVLKPGRWRASLGDIVGALDASVRGGVSGLSMRGGVSGASMRGGVSGASMRGGVSGLSLRGGRGFGPATSPRGSFVSTDESNAHGSDVQRRGSVDGAREAMDAMEAGATVFELDDSQPWWSSDAALDAGNRALAPQQDSA